MDGISIVYRFRGHEWLDSINWVRGGTSFARTRDERLQLLRNWIFPRWSLETWKEQQMKQYGPPKFPNEVQLERNGKRGDDLLAQWKMWFGPEGRRESLCEDGSIRLRHPREWFDHKNRIYLMTPEDHLVISRGMDEKTYSWKREA
jgi:hypothetical protein